MPDAATPIRFGTDGWRAIIADEFTFENVRRCAQAVAAYLKEEGQEGGGLAVGYDTRFASQEFAEAVAEVSAANGIRVFLCDRPAPTPVIGYAILTHKASGSVVITSSHNPALYSGFKARTAYAGSAPPDVISRIESLIPGPREPIPATPLDEARESGLV